MLTQPEILEHARSAGPWTDEAAARIDELRRATKIRKLIDRERDELRVLRMRESVEAARRRRA